MKSQRKHAEHTTYTPKSPEDAARWYREQKEKKRVVYWDKVKKEMISSDDSDLRNLPVKDRSKVARIYSEANIIDLLTSHWEETPIAEGRVVTYRGHKYIMKEVTVVKAKKRPVKNTRYLRESDL